MIPIVLCYHQVVRRARPEHYSLQSALTVEQFRTAMVDIKERWHPLGIDEFVWIYQNGRRWPKRSVLITFDDGFKNNLWAAEVLRDLEMTAVFFVTSGAVGTKFRPWHVKFAQLISTCQCDALKCSWGAVDFRNRLGRRRWLKLAKEHLLALRPAARETALQELANMTGCDSREAPDPDLEFFCVQDLRRLRELGMTVGGHTRTHDNLTGCSAVELQSEIVESADELSQWIGTSIQHFAYPDGRFDRQTVEMVRARYDAAFTIQSRYTAADLWRLPRRAADGYSDVGQVLSPFFPAKRKLVDTVKRILQC